MDASSLFSSANGHYVNEDYEEALKHYTCAVTLQEDCVEYRCNRAATYLKLGKFAEALEDCELALKCGPRSHMVLHWKGIALFYMGDFSGAKLSFEESLRLSGSAQAPRAVWVRKCDAELSGSTLPLGGVAAEIARPAVAAAQPSVAAASSTAAPAASSAVAASAPAPAPSPASDKNASLSISGRKPTRREWYQNNTHVYVTIFAKGVDEKACKVDFQEKELSLSFPLPGGAPDEEYQLDISLNGAVDPAACKLEVSKVKVEVILCKKIIGVSWTDLEAKDEVVVPMSVPEQPAYPTSSKKKKDWGSIDREIEADLKAEKPEGDQALNTLFKQIYERADDETRRAMNKSFQTSGGTVLSTNWGEVAKSDYEGKDRPTAPEGQEWKDWNKK